MSTDTTPTGRSTPVVSRVLGWLTAGYPDGIPAQDRFAVVALLKRRLTDDQVREIVADLTAERPALSDREISQQEVEQLIHRVLQEQPTEDDVHRVSARLAAGGWPLANELGSRIDGEDDETSSDDET
jgi:hypothetical protein